MNNFDPEKAVAKLKANRKDYIDRVMAYLKQSIETFGDYEMAANYIVAAADSLKSLNSVFDFLSVIADTDDGYPEFGAMLD